jgi:hypothetical protein
VNLLKSVKDMPVLQPSRASESIIGTTSRNINGTVFLGVENAHIRVGQIVTCGYGFGQAEHKFEA